MIWRTLHITKLVMYVNPFIQVIFAITQYFLSEFKSNLFPILEHIPDDSLNWRFLNIEIGNGEIFQKFCRKPRRFFPWNQNRCGRKLERFYFPNCFKFFLI